MAWKIHLRRRYVLNGILKPKDILVNLNGGRQASVAVFNLEAMILSLVLDDRFMHPDNIADGYDLFTGKSMDLTIIMVKFTQEMHGFLRGIIFVVNILTICHLLLLFLGVNLIWTCMDHYPHCHLLSPYHVSMSTRETNLNFGDHYHSFLIYHTVHHHPKTLPICMIVFRTSMIV
jgi:hypothetical protein